MQRLSISIALLLLVLSGCSRGLDPDSDRDVAASALRTAMEAWKSGKAPDDLANEQPPIIMNEDDWRSGKRLLDFKVEESGLSGRQIRCKVQIKLREKDGRTVERNAIYIIDTTPRIVIVRDSFASASRRADRLEFARATYCTPLGE
jgi:hypothetical protein